MFRVWVCSGFGFAVPQNAPMHTRVVVAATKFSTYTHLCRVVAFGLPLCPGGAVNMFLTMYNSPSLNALGRFLIFLGWKVSCFAITLLFARVACFGMRDDVQLLTILFGVVC